LGCDHTKVAGQKQTPPAGREKSPPQGASFPEGIPSFAQRFYVAGGKSRAAKKNFFSAV
jgi:hypothetical protein